jgi:asparagine synthase (glutamine-hydrolysing)
MCGIAGVLSPNKIQDAQQLLKAAIGSLQHRGPEQQQYWINADETVALGHSRLCIIDLEPRAHQPLRYLNRYQIIHNGELYNYLELKTSLQKKGFNFFTESDTEVIVAAYHAYKKDCLQEFDGMFAFAIWAFGMRRKKFCLQPVIVLEKNLFSFITTIKNF